MRSRSVAFAPNFPLSAESGSSPLTTRAIRLSTSGPPSAAPVGRDIDVLEPVPSDAHVGRLTPTVNSKTATAATDRHDKFSILISPMGLYVGKGPSAAESTISVP